MLAVLYLSIHGYRAKLDEKVCSASIRADISPEIRKGIEGLKINTKAAPHMFFRFLLNNCISISLVPQPPFLPASKALGVRER